MLTNLIAKQMKSMLNIFKKANKEWLSKDPFRESAVSIAPLYLNFIHHMNVLVKNNIITEFRVNAKITFEVLN